ncbi:glycosyltransferase [Photobacterium leiognathi]|uniref:glycosyltransferase n=1 Tax=Photobacterium leiognathi TaxID=553611 RepID=UPI0029815BF9|nr:glycosyltransferase [Photobacterium leiognathi]
MFKVCTLLAAYNGEQFIKEQLDSILNQDNVDNDIYISLDLSTDRTIDIIDDYKKKYNNIFLLPYGQKFGSAGQNFFHLLTKVDFSKYDYVAFSDQDDIWLPNKLKRALSMLQKSESDGYSSNVTAFWKSGKKVLVRKDYPQTEFDYIFESSGPGCTFVLRTSLAIDIKQSLDKKRELIKKLWLHDWYCYAFSRENKRKWYIDSEPLMLYRQHETNQVGANQGLSQILSRFKVILSGDAFDKVMAQADFIAIKNKPILLLSKNNFISYLKLSFLAFKCRRKPMDKIAFFIIILLMSIKSLFHEAK